MLCVCLFYLYWRQTTLAFLMILTIIGILHFFRSFYLKFLIRMGKCIRDSKEPHYTWNSLCRVSVYCAWPEEHQENVSFYVEVKVPGNLNSRNSKISVAIIFLGLKSQGDFVNQVNDRRYCRPPCWKPAFLLYVFSCYHLKGQLN